MKAASRLSIPLMFLVFAACATPPAVQAPAPAPVPVPDVPIALSVEGARVVPRGLDSVAVSFSVVAANTDGFPLEMDSLAWELYVNGEKAAEERNADIVQIASGAAATTVRECIVDVPSSALDTAEFKVFAKASRRVAGNASLSSVAEAAGRFPVIREPVFSIQSIKIKKSELINTKFEVVLRIENPNAVPLRMKTLEYELFGEGRLWTDGEFTESIPIAANETVDKKLFLTMNFINMKRELLDQVIRLEIVDYRFKGKAKITTELPEFPEFQMPYDLAGRTSVVE